MQGLNDTTITAEHKYSINVSRSEIKCCLRPHHNRNNSFLLLNVKKIYQVNVIISEIKPYFK